MTFGEKLKSLRKEQGLSTKDLAKKSGLSVVSIINYENDHLLPNVISLNKLATALDYDFDKLYEFTKE